MIYIMGSLWIFFTLEFLGLGDVILGDIVFGFVYGFVLIFAIDSALFPLVYI